MCKYKAFCYHIAMSKRTLPPIHLRETLFVLLLAFFALPLSVASIADPEKSANSVVVEEKLATEQKWEPSEQDRLKVMFLSYQYLHAKDNNDANAAFALFAETTKSSIDFKKWKYNLVLFNATAGEKTDSKFTRVSWFEVPSGEPVSGIFATVDYSSVFANINIQCGSLMWHKKDDGSFELMSEQQNYIDKTSQEKLSDSEIVDIKTKFGCREP